MVGEQGISWLPTSFSVHRQKWLMVFEGRRLLFYGVVSQEGGEGGGKAGMAAFATTISPAASGVHTIRSWKRRLPACRERCLSWKPSFLVLARCASMALLVASNDDLGSDDRVEGFERPMPGRGDRRRSDIRHGVWVSGRRKRGSDSGRWMGGVRKVMRDGGLCCREDVGTSRTHCACLPFLCFATHPHAHGETGNEDRCIWWQLTHPAGWRPRTGGIISVSGVPERAARWDEWA